VRENPNVGKPNERERDIIIQLQESTKQQQIHISSQGKYLTTPKQSHQILPRFSCQIRTVVRPSLYLNFHAKSQLYELFRMAQKQQDKILKSASKIVPKNASIFVPNPYGCTIVRNCMNCTDPYSMASHNRKITLPKNT
jgi:hypothetical protein